MKLSSKEKPVITVIIATKNSAGTLQRCIDSFASQTCQHKELIIIDGGSNDGTAKILRDNNHIIDYWEAEPDRGIAHAWNKALKLATGEWIHFLGSDDCFASSNALEEFTKRIAGHSLKNGRIIYGMIRRFFPDGGYLDTQGRDWSTVRPVFFSEKMMIPHQACFHHSSLFKEFGTFDEEYCIVADYEYLLRILKIEGAVFLPDFVVTNMNFGGISSRISTLLVMQNECDMALKKHGFKPKGYKRAGNILIYKLLSLVVKIGGERMAARILDMFRIILGKNPVWSRKYKVCSVM